jgi:hypothetical protein
MSDFIFVAEFDDWNGKLVIHKIKVFSRTKKQLKVERHSAFRFKTVLNHNQVYAASEREALTLLLASLRESLDYEEKTVKKLHKQIEIVANKLEAVDE